MPVKIIPAFILFLVFNSLHVKAQAVAPKDRICGTWECTEKNIRIQVYTEGDEFRAKLIWFSDTEGKPMDYWTDRNNPDESLRSRKILGLNMLSGLKYNPDKNIWDDGMVYDSKHGKYWNAEASLDKKGMLEVRGYWHFKFIGKTMDFVRMQP